MELKDILELVKDSKVYIGLSYIGQNDYKIIKIKRKEMILWEKMKKIH